MCPPALLDGFFDEVHDADGTPRPHAAALADAPAAARPGVDRVGRPPPRRDLHAAGHHLRRRRPRRRRAGPRPPVPARPRPADHPRATSGGRSSAAWPSASARSTTSSTTSTTGARSSTTGIVPWELIVSPPRLRARRARHPPARRRLLPRLGLRPRARRRRLVEGARGQRPHAERDLLRAREPRRDDAAAARPVRATTACGRSTTTRRCCASALHEVAPTGGEEEPTIVVWTPGPFNSAYFEHAFLARQMGVELVEASDLVVSDAVCYIRTTRGLERVHAIYRRIDDDFMDPLEFRPDSLLGVPGLMRAYRAGTVAIVNAVGTGVADDKAIYHYVPEMVRYYLDEEPILENVTTYLMADPEQRAAHPRPPGRGRRQADERVRRQGRLHRPDARPTRRSPRRRRRCGASPSAGSRRSSCGCRPVPTAMPDGTLSPRHVDLRPFAVFGEEIHIVPGGLTRVALREGSMIVNSSPGRRLEGHLGARGGAGRAGRGRARRRAGGRRRGCPTCAPAREWIEPATATAAVGCSPGSPTSCTGSAAASRAPSTPRACSTASSTPTCRAAPTTRPRCA